jgi:hypothetical protein
MTCAACGHHEIDHEGLACMRGCDCRGFEEPCSPRCSGLHALDCPHYDGPLSRTGTLAKPERDVVW